MTGIITLTTDFGTGSFYVAEMKAVLLDRAPGATVVDITHEVPPQSVRYGAWLLDRVAPRFPHGAIHVAVVDPGVGTDRRIVCAQIGHHWYVAPDNGLLTLLQRRLPVHQLRVVENPRFWLPVVSSTFHGRDIMAPVAAALARGCRPEDLGGPADELVQIPLFAPRLDGPQIHGEILWFDHFGNAITNIPGEMLGGADSIAHVSVGGRPELQFQPVRTYGQAPPGTPVVLIGSHGHVELAVVQGNARRTLKLSEGDTVTIVRDVGTA